MRRVFCQPCENGCGLWRLSSNQKRSPNLRFWNCLAKIQANVGPTTAPFTGISAIPAGHRSTSSTCLDTQHNSIVSTHRYINVQMCCTIVLICLIFDGCMVAQRVVDSAVRSNLRLRGFTPGRSASTQRLRAR